MKSNYRIIIFIFTLFASIVSTYAQSPPEKLLQEMVQQLQATPDDDALREKIIRLGAEIKPAPAIPEEAIRRMSRGAAAFKSATSAADYQDAVNEFKQATMAAPWYGDAYYNLGVAQDKAEQFEAALRSLKLARLATQDSKELTALIYEVEYRMEKANSPAARAESQKQLDEELVRSLDGVRFDCPEIYYAPTGERKEHWLMIEGNQLTAWLKYLQIDPDRARVEHVGKVINPVRLPILGTVARDEGPNWEQTYMILTSTSILRSYVLDGITEESYTCFRR